MIDFRYHLVSLISVFMALAVGIVLGAGPLKESIGDTLTGEVDALRQTAADLRTELDETGVVLGQTEDAFAAVAPDLLDGILDGRRVAVIGIGDADGSTLDRVSERLEEAGAEVSGTVRVTQEWSDTSRRTYRQTLAATLVDYLDPRPATDAGTPVELAEALVQGLTTRAEANPDALSEEAGVVLDLLREGGLVEIDGEVTGPADALVLVAGPAAHEPATEDGAADAEPTQEELAEIEACVTAAAAIAVAAQTRSSGAVVAADALTDDGVIQVLRENVRTTRSVSTVTGVDTLIGQVSVPLALAERIGGGAGHYGTDADVTGRVPGRVVLPPPDRPVVVPEEDLPPGDADVEGSVDQPGGEATVEESADAEASG